MIAEQSPEKLDPQARQILGLSSLLQLEKRVRHASSKAEFGFMVVNETLNLLQYRQAILWRRTTANNARIIAISGVGGPNRNSPYVQWLRKLCRYLATQKDAQSIHPITQKNAPIKLQQGWDDWSIGHVLWCPLVAANGEFLGGLVLLRENSWQEVEAALLERLADAYAHAWQALLRRTSWQQQREKKAIGRLARWIIIGVAFASLALPVRLSVLAPAQIEAIDPLVVSSPLKGVIKQFHVLPNQEVEAGQLLLSLDDTELKNRLAVAQKTLAVTNAEYRRARQKSLLDKKSGLDADLLKARVDQKQAEVEYVADELARIAVKAKQGGIVIFSDVNDWLGKPVVTGEKILTIADQQQVELAIQVPIDNAINLEQGAEVRMFLNIDPSRHISATIRQTSYEAEVTEEGILAFPVKASLDQKSKDLRIGLQGTAKIYGRETRLYYYLFRRPWSALRKTLGL